MDSEKEELTVEDCIPVTELSEDKTVGDPLDADSLTKESELDALPVEKVLLEEEEGPEISPATDEILIGVLL